MQQHLIRLGKVFDKR